MRANAIGVVVAVNVVLVGALAYLWNDDERARWREPAAVSPSLEDVVTAPRPEPADVSRYRETVERPLFAASRKVAPRAEAGAEAQAAADSLRDVRLLGTYGAGERGGIVVLAGGKVQRLAIGESIGGWRVTGGGAGRSAELIRADGQRRQLELVLNNTSPGATAAAKGDVPEGDTATAADQAQPAAASAAAAPRARPERARSARSRATTPEARQQMARERRERRRAPR